MNWGKSGLACVALSLALAPGTLGQSFRFTKILDGLTTRPDGLGAFYIRVGTATPSFDGKWVTFRDPGPQNDDGSHATIWSYNTQDGSFHKLVDFNTPIPASTAFFHDFQLNDTAPILRNGTFVFVARDTSAQQGLYSMPAAGGVIREIATVNTADPSGGTFSLFDSYSRPLGAFSFDGTTVAFNANGSQSTVGNYSVLPDGTGLRLLADNLHPYNASVRNFGSVAINGNNAVMFGTDGTPNNLGYNGLYLAGLGGGGAVTELVNSNQQLPGNTNAGFHTRFDAPILALDGTLAVFHATDTKSPISLAGLYATDLSSHTITRIADLNTALTGINAPAAVATNGVAVNQGSVLFKANDSTGHSALFLWRAGTLTRVVGTGDKLDGRTVQGIAADPGPASLSGSRFVFTVDFGNDRAFYLATANSGPVLSAVMNSASRAATSIAPGETLLLTGTGLGPAAPISAQFGASRQLPRRLDGVRVLIGGTAVPLLHVGDTQVGAIVPFGAAVGTNTPVVVEYNGTASAPLNMAVTNTMPGLFSADASGSGEGVIQNADGSLNRTLNPAAPGSAITLWATGLGALSPAPADGSIVSGTAPVLQHPVSVTIGGHAAQVLSQGPLPGVLAGIYAIQCVVPQATAAGTAAVVITSDGRHSQANLTVAVR